MAAVASTGLAIAQEGDRIVTVAEQGKPAHQCKILETHTKPDGMVVHRVKDLVTGDIFNLEEPAGSATAKPATHSEPTKLAAHSEPAPAAPAAAPTRTLTVTETGKPPQKARVVQDWRLPDGYKAYQVQAVESGEMMTIVETGPAAGAQGSASRTISTRIYHWGKLDTPPVGAPVPPPAAVVKTVTPMPTVVKSTTAPPATTTTKTVTPIPAPAVAKATSPTPAAPVMKSSTPSTLTPVATTSTPTVDGMRVWPAAYANSTSSTPAPSTLVDLPRTTTTPYAATGPQQTTKSTATTKALTPVATNTTSPTCDCQPAQPSKLPLLTKTTKPSATVVGSTCDCQPAQPPKVVSPTANLASTANDAKPVTPFASTTAPRSIPQPSVGSTASSTLTVTPKLETWKPTPPTQVAQAPAPATTPYTNAATKSNLEPAQPSDWRQAWGKTDSPAATTTASTAHTDTKSPYAGTMALPPAGKPDPLTDPAKYTRSAVEDKVAPSPLATQAMNSQTVVTTKKDMPAPSSVKVDNGMQLPPMPLGSRSIMDASSVAMDAPAPQTPPSPMTMAASKAAQAVQASPAQGPMLNAFTPAASVPSVATTGPNANAFGQAPSPQVASAFGSMPMNPPTWQPAAPSRPMPPTPALALASPMPQNVAPTMPAAVPMPMQRPGYAVAMSAPPQTGLTLASHSVGTIPMEGQLPARGSMNTHEMIGMLHDSLLPSQREWAADQLGSLDWKANQPAVDALVKSCQQDPAATVRASCVRSLARMNVNLVPVVDALRGLKSDADPRVQTEVEQALAKLGSH